MNRLVALTCCVVLSGSLTACTSATVGRRAVHSAPGTVSHVVVCNLKDPNDASVRRKLVEATKSFADIPGVLRIDVGRPIASPRPVVAKDYDLALVVTFEDRAALEAYEVNPKHQRAVKELLLPVTSKIVVYDFTNE